VRYTLQARVDRPGRFDSTRSLPLPVRGNAVDARVAVVARADLVARYSRGRAAFLSRCYAVH
jgi:hypothetical protein